MVATDKDRGTEWPTETNGEGSYSLPRLPIGTYALKVTHAGFQAADRAMQTLGGMGYALEYDVERYWREARLMRIAPVPQEMTLAYVAEHVLGLARSY